MQPGGATTRAYRRDNAGAVLVTLKQIRGPFIGLSLLEDTDSSRTPALGHQQDGIRPIVAARAGIPRTGRADNGATRRRSPVAGFDRVRVSLDPLPHRQETES